MHVTESCDEEAPHLITDVQTTPAPLSDFDMTLPIQESLARHEIVPEEHLVDAGYVTAEHLVDSQVQHGVDLIGPVASDPSWQAQARQGYGTADFTIDWQTHTARCPQGCQSCLWMLRKDRHEHEVIHIKFATADCLACAARSLCTHASKEPRSLMIRSEQTYVALQEARRRQQTLVFKDQYAKRAGIEGTLSQGVRAFELRRSRYVGEAKTRLQHLMIGVAINAIRLFAWEQKLPRGHIRRSRLAALAPSEQAITTAG